MKLVIFADGGSRGNPGIAGSGTAVYSADRKQLLREIAYVVGTKSTNNVAEYHGLLRGLEAAVEMGADDVDFYMDSKLVVEQMNGRWKIKHPDMQALALEARKLIDQIGSFTLTWVPRAKNKAADALSNVAMDAAAAGAPVGIVGAGEEVTADTAAPQPSDWMTEQGPVTRFILVRHGQTEMSAAKQYSGHADPELTELGKKQALAAAQALAETQVDAIVCSPLKRCQQTAQAIAASVRPAHPDGTEGEKPSIETVEGLIEVDFGLWEGKTFAQAHATDEELHSQWLEDPSVACPGGESLQQVHRRVRKTRQELQETYAGKTVVVVSHVNPIKSFIRQSLDAGPVTFNRLFLDLASISIAEFWDGGSMLRGFNDVGHLRALG